MNTKKQLFVNLRWQDSGQAMTEYVIVVGIVLIGVLTINGAVIPHLNDLYKLIADVVRLPFP